MAVTVETPWLELADSPGNVRHKNLSSVFILAAFIVQALMSYDGGATQLSTHNLREYGGWGASELGLLMAMDRVGVVLTGSLWSVALSKYNAKSLLILGVGAKAASCFLFAVLQMKWSMLLAKFFMGVWEGLFAIWVTTWVGQNAPKGSKEKWQNFLGMMAAFGNGGGGLIAGLLSRYFALAFVFQAVMLGLIWCFMVTIPAGSFALESYEGSGSLSQSSSSLTTVSSIQDLGAMIYPPKHLSNYWKASRHHMVKASEETWKGLRWIWAESVVLARDCPLWFHTALAFSNCFFITTGIGSLWQNMVVSVWGFTDIQATISMQMTMTLGGLPGGLFGPKWINSQLDPERHLDDPQRRQHCLAICRKLTLCAAACASLCVLPLFTKIGILLHSDIPQRKACDGFLLVMLPFISILFFCINAVQGFFVEINRTCVELRQQSFAIGLTLNCQNLFGFALGPFLPGVVTEVFGRWLAYTWPSERTDAVAGSMFAFGMCFVLIMAWTLCMFTCFSYKAALTH